jgi:transcriptional regulator with XRE-family HTH domain
MTTRKWVVRDGEDLGRAVAEIRRERNLSQEHAAQLVNLRRDRLAKLETGKSTVAMDQLLRSLRRLGAEVTITFDSKTGTVKP